MQALDLTLPIFCGVTIKFNKVLSQEEIIKRLEVAFPEGFAGRITYESLICGDYTL